ncbi:hypothetical protein Q4519_18765 [Motilimonas sp. 1_MG-2023]|uniref:hypothetical protein n=1 Tax=Motilimonas sp. 1_MG-2023 TaxID=3062672 RepID=UPI0026E3051C|nr:hypothetical protein [Motilimonas sp. 1_MG-2023]MDO6527721.1 hypothetical protein [Motilimonas sp. 1_MG-2023]
MKIDRKMRWVARILFVAFSFVVIRMLFEGGYGYTSAGVERYVSINSSPIKYCFALIWQTFIACVSFYFGFMVKLEEVEDKGKS